MGTGSIQHLEDVATIPVEDKTLLREARAAITRLAPEASVSLYDSGARGAREPREPREPDSDLDLLIPTTRPVPRSDERQATDALYDLE